MSLSGETVISTMDAQTSTSSTMNEQTSTTSTVNAQTSVVSTMNSQISVISTTTSQTSNEQHGRVFNICTDGDIFLVVGVQQVRMRVSSTYLISVSKTFATLLKGKTVPLELALPNDFSDSIWTLCCIIHHRIDLVKQPSTSLGVLHLAIGSNKYALNDILKFASSVWLKPAFKMSMIETGYLLAAALLFDNQEMVKSHTSALILGYSTSYTPLAQDAFVNKIINPTAFGMYQSLIITLLVTNVSRSVGAATHGTARKIPQLVE
jgi:hypothetical protein